MPVASLREDQQRCDVCGSASGRCACTAATTDLAARAAELSRAAFDAASASELHRAGVVTTAHGPASNLRMLWGTLAAAALIVVAAIYGFSRRQPIEAVAGSEPVGLESRADSVALARTLGQILAAESDSAVDILRALEPHTRQWPAAARARANAIAQERGRAHFAAGEKSFDSGQWRAAVRDLSWAVTYGGGGDYHARAMYLLARSHVRTSQPSSAQLQAQEVLRQYPGTRHADHVMRAIAATGREP